MKQSSLPNEERARVEKGQAVALPRLRRAIGLVGRIAAAILIIFVTLILIGSGIVYYEGKGPPTGNSQYVALGGSFSACPGVGERDPENPTLCIRSAQDYPWLLAQARHLNLTDVTCSGATTQHVLYGGQAFQPPQLDALRSSTGLVTVSIGGNDVSYVTNILSWAWIHLFLMRRRARLALSPRQVYTLTLFIVMGVLVGGSFIEVAFDEWQFYRHHPSLIPAYWLGGMATHGLLLGAALAAGAFAVTHRKSFLAIADELVIPGAILMGLGRIGNFIDGQIVGAASDVWWAVKFLDAGGFVIRSCCTTGSRTCS